MTVRGLLSGKIFHYSGLLCRDLTLTSNQRTARSPMLCSFSRNSSGRHLEIRSSRTLPREMNPVFFGFLRRKALFHRRESEHSFTSACKIAVRHWCTSLLLQEMLGSILRGLLIWSVYASCRLEAISKFLCENILEDFVVHRLSNCRWVLKVTSVHYEERV